MRRLSLSPLRSPRENGSQLDALLTPAGTARERNSDLLDLKTVRLSARTASHLLCANEQAEKSKMDYFSIILCNTFLLAQNIHRMH